MAAGGRKSGFGRNDYLHQLDRLWDPEEFWLQFIEAVVKVAKRHGNSRTRGKWIEVFSTLQSGCGISLSTSQVVHLQMLFSRLKCQEERGFPEKLGLKLDFATPLVKGKMHEYLQEFPSIRASHESESHVEPDFGPLSIEASDDVKDSPGFEIEIEPAPRRDCNGGHGSVTGDHGSITHVPGDRESFGQSNVRRSPRNVNKPRPDYFSKGPDIEETPVTMKLPESSLSMKRKLEEGHFPSKGERSAVKEEESESCFTAPSEILSHPCPSECNEVEMNNVKLMDEYFDEFQAMICDRLIPTAKRDARQRITSKESTMGAAKKVQLSFPKGRIDEGDNCYPHWTSRRDMERVGTEVFAIVMQATARASHHLELSGVEGSLATDSCFLREFDELNGKISALLKRKTNTISTNLKNNTCTCTPKDSKTNREQKG